MANSGRGSARSTAPTADAGPVWFRRLCAEGSGSGAQLVFHPPAGANASAGGQLTAAVPDAWSVWGVQYPARGPRLRDRPATSVREMATSCLRELPGEPSRTVLFGHSFGAIVAYDLAQLLERQGRPAAGLLVAGSSAPEVATRTMPSADAGDASLIRFLGDRGGTAAHVLEHDELMRMTLRALRIDLTIAREYTDDHGRRLSTGIVALGGRDDPAVSVDHLGTWRQLTESWLGFELGDGDHFSYLRDPELMGRVLHRHWATVGGSGD